MLAKNLTQLSTSVLFALALTACGSSSDGDSTSTSSNNTSGSNTNANTNANNNNTTTSSLQCGTEVQGGVYYVTNLDISKCGYKDDTVKSKIMALYDAWQAARIDFLTQRSDTKKDKLTETKTAFEAAVKSALASGDMFTDASANGPVPEANPTNTTTTVEAVALDDITQYFDINDEETKKLLVGVQVESNGKTVTSGTNLQGTYVTNKAAYFAAKDGKTGLAYSHEELKDMATQATKLGMEGAEYHLRLALKQALADGTVTAKNTDEAKKAVAYVTADEVTERNLVGTSINIDDYDYSSDSVKAELEALTTARLNANRIFLGSTGRGATNADGKQESISVPTGATDTVSVTGPARLGMGEAAVRATEAFQKAIEDGTITKKDLLANTPLKQANRLSTLADVAGTYQVNFGRCKLGGGRYGTSTTDCTSFFTGSLQLTFDAQGKVSNAQLVDGTLFTSTNGTETQTDITNTTISFSGAKLVANADKTFTFSYDGITGTSIPDFAKGKSSNTLVFAKDDSNTYFTSYNVPVRYYVEKTDSGITVETLNTKMPFSFVGQKGLTSSTAPTALANGTYSGAGGSGLLIVNRKLGNLPADSTSYTNTQSPFLTAYSTTLDGTQTTVIAKYAHVFKTVTTGRGGTSTTYPAFWLSSPDGKFFGGSEVSASVVVSR